jgi:hypothetical protein
MQTSPALSLPYEIAAEHDSRLTRTASWTRQLAIVWMTAAGFFLFSGAIAHTVVAVVFAVLLVRAAKDLRAIVRTRGNDVALLMDATDMLARTFRLRVRLVCLAMAVFVFGFVAARLSGG